MGLFDILEPLPESWKVNYSQAEKDKSIISWLLWAFLSPGWTAIFLFLTGLYYYYLAKNESSAEAKKQLNDVGFALVSWGVLNGACYILLVLYQKQNKFSTKTPQEKDNTRTKSGVVKFSEN